MNDYEQASKERDDAWNRVEEMAKRHSPLLILFSLERALRAEAEEYSLLEIPDLSVKLLQQAQIVESGIDDIKKSILCRS